MTISRKEFGKLKLVTVEDDERLKKEAGKEYMQNWYGINKEKVKGKSRQRYKENKEKCKEQSCQWRKENKERNSEIQKKYDEKHKEERKNYEAEYRQTEAGKVARRKVNHKRRGLGFLELNEPFEGSEAHHINKDTVVYIPKELHQSVKHNVFSGEGMVEINNKVTEWLIDIGELMPSPA